VLQTYRSYRSYDNNDQTKHHAEVNIPATGTVLGAGGVLIQQQCVHKITLSSGRGVLEDHEPQLGLNIPHNRVHVSLHTTVVSPSVCLNQCCVWVAVAHVVICIAKACSVLHCTRSVPLSQGGELGGVVPHQAGPLAASRLATRILTQTHTHHHTHTEAREQVCHHQEGVGGLKETNNKRMDVRWMSDGWMWSAYLLHGGALDRCVCVCDGVCVMV
jgi:hypothetical protein